MMKYYLWTSGCQMNVADSQRVASSLERLGYLVTSRVEEADVIVLNTCVVRQSAEDRAYGRLFSLRPIKERRPEVVINLMGCLVGIKGHDRLKKKLPFVDVFSPPSDPGPLIAYLTQNEGRRLEEAETLHRFTLQDGNLRLPHHEQGKLVSAFIPVIYGCSHACTYCIVPYQRGSERSRDPQEILSEVKSLVSQGVKEVTLLGQIVDRYGKDDPNVPDLADLLHIVHQLDGLERIRFLTSHPKWMTDKLLNTIVELPKVMPHIEVPVQAGDDDILEKMKRGYTIQEFERLVVHARDLIPGVSIATDVIVGFPSESASQFQRTADLLARLKFDVVHIARYSPRTGTLAERRLTDDVSEDEKWRRFRLLEELQEEIAEGINGLYSDKTVEVLFEENVRGRWKGRTPTNKLVFVQSDENLRGRLLDVQIIWTGPWSMQGRLPLHQPTSYSTEPAYAEAGR
ncbi:MAG: tRNA (N6-isopentenyl adenosine(37)-C2)-methylthiotransferase MiaB [Chloroflexota bacterium]